MIRAFIAIDLPSAVRAAIGAAQEELKRTRLDVRVAWARAANLHLTLQFLGHVEETLIPKLSDALERVVRATTVFGLPVAGAGAFPNEGRPRVLWVGCPDPSGRLAGLARSVQEATAAFGFPADDRPFMAHLTLGRIKHPRPDAALTQALASLKNRAFGTFRVDAIHLFQSQLHPAGSIYTKLSSHKLKETD